MCVMGTLIALAAAMVACSRADKPAGQQDVTVTPAEPATTAKPSSVESRDNDLAVSLPDLGPAPDITNEVWLNTDSPLNLEAVRGRVVLVEFWTFG